MGSMYDNQSMCDYVHQNLEWVCYPFRGYRCHVCGSEARMKKSMGNAKGAMIAHLKKHYRDTVATANHDTSRCLK